MSRRPNTARRRLDEAASSLAEMQDLVGKFTKKKKIIDASPRAPWQVFNDHAMSDAAPRFQTETLPDCC